MAQLVGRGQMREAGRADVAAVGHVASVRDHEYTQFALRRLDGSVRHAGRNLKDDARVYEIAGRGASPGWSKLPET